MKPVRLPASATNALPRWMLLGLCMLYILPGLIRRDPWKPDDAAGFGIMWTMAHGGLNDWLWPHIAGLPMADKGPLAFWVGAVCIKLFGPLLGDVLAARVATIGFFLLGCLAVWYTTYLLGRRPETQPLRLAFGGQPEPKDYGRTLADGALLIYLGCLGLMVHSHSTSAGALMVSLVAASMYGAVRLLETQSARAAAVFGLTLGLLILSYGWVVPLAIWLGLLVLTAMQSRKLLLRLLLVTLPLAVAVAATWLVAARIERPFDSTPYDTWMVANYRQIGLPSWDAFKYFVRNAIWFAWPAWPYAGWAVYAWRRQSSAPHIVLPLTFAVAVIVAALLNRYSEESILLPLIPPLAMLAAFGLPTMKRGAINAVDWFSVMTLTVSAAFIWIGWIAKQTGWPAQLAHNAFKLAPGFRPEFNGIAFLIAVAATIGWFVLVQWRISRRPSVLWRAVVLSTGGVILCWTLLMTLWIPWGNYIRSYAGVARDIADHLPGGSACVDSNVGPAQRASFAYFGNVPFARFSDVDCKLLLLQDDNRDKQSAKLITRAGGQWELLWEGRRASDRDERYRLYQRIR
ncbi:glycosyltransferase [Oxalobacteraceae bacterium OM1]|nr:glycosyltransferase [Oxalobacteraceae bacterium OM1]